MEFNNTRFKINEASYFLDKLQRSYDEAAISEYYQNAFLISARSVIDYVVWDFFDVINFKISVPDWLDTKTKQRIIEQDKNSKLIFDFLADHKSKKDVFLQCPLNNYFWLRRNVLIHRNPLHRMMSTKALIDGRPTTIFSSLEKGLNPNYIVAHPEEQTNFGMELDEISRGYFESIVQLADGFDVLCRFQRAIIKFVEQFEDKYADFNVPTKNR